MKRYPAVRAVWSGTTFSGGGERMLSSPYWDSCGAENDAHRVRALLIASDEGGPLTWRYVGQPTISVMGRAWGRSNLGQPVTADERADFGVSIGTCYAETISTGEVVVNRVRLHGLGRPLAYMHALIGWEADGRRGVLSCVQL